MAELLRAPRDLVLTDVEVDGRRVDVVIRDGQLGGTPKAGADVVHGRGGALLPGLNDHHLHLLATAAAARSIDCGPPSVRTAEQLRGALAVATGQSVRGTGYHESVAGPLDRALLDDLHPGRPVRVQHRTGGVWVLNSRALQELGVTQDDGRLWRGDPRLGHSSDVPDIAALGDELALLGVLGACDATPDLGPDALRLLVEADLPQQVLALGAPDDWDHPGVRRGPRKVLLGDEDLDWDSLVARVTQAHEVSRAVAIHVVTREGLLLALAALEQVGVVPGDRLEHAAVVPPDAVPRLAGLTVVTQPALAARRGDDYLRDVDPRDCPDLWRYGSLQAQGVDVVPSSDAPYGPLDPWQVLRSARDRETPSGQLLGEAERVPVRVALDGMLAPLETPGGPPRRVGDGGDLVLLHVPLEEVLRDPRREHVRLVCAAR
ncbi:MAG: amidohydrolase [Frankiales bacterium]|nr:amidohydrolase [Frankiales bacterium]